MNILIGGWFTLPRMERETFARLMKEGVRYDKEMGFKLDYRTDIESAVRTLASALGEEIFLIVRCVICGREACPRCPYLDSCDRRRVSTLCLCMEHPPSEQVYDLYKKVLRENMSA